MHLPKIGFGTWQLKGQQAESAVLAAIEAGYRLIDTAKIYGNEVEVGRAIKTSGVERAQLFITTKLWQSDMGYDSAKAAFNNSLANLGLDYIDLYLIHWPGHSAQKRAESWKALQEIHKSGLAKHIGVSNYGINHLSEIEAAPTQPYVNQIELHPFIYANQKQVAEYCHKKNILIEAYSPLAQADNLSNQLLVSLADKYSKTPAQIMLRWALQKGATPIPRSSNPERITQNLNIFDFEITSADMSQLDGLSSGKSALG